MDASYHASRVIRFRTASSIAQLVKNLPAMQETPVQSLGWEDLLKKGKGYPLQHSSLENSTDCIVHGVAESRTWLSKFHLLTYIFLNKSPLGHSFEQMLPQTHTGRSIIMAIPGQIFKRTSSFQFGLRDP